MSVDQKAVFLSYASQDAEAALRLCSALRAAGVEVWFDADGGLEHGDEWDAKIRRQIKECVLFIPLISVNTQAREEGYFRLEWELAAQRAMSIASGVAFILPVVIDDMREPHALVPDRFRMVQWTRLPGGAVTPEVTARFLKLWSYRIGGGPATPQGGGAERGVAVLPQRPRRRFPAPAWLVAAGLTAAVFACFDAFRPKRTQPAAAPSATPAVGSSSGSAAEKRAPLSEARQLVARTWTLLNRPEMGRVELDTADALCKRAVAADPTDAEVWAAWAHVHTWMVHHNFDRSDSRYEAAADCAARAMRLDPEGYESRVAQACYWVRGLRQSRDAIAQEARKLLRQLLGEKPDDPRVLSALGFSLLKIAGTKPEGHEVLERLAKNTAFAQLAWMDIGWEHRFRGEFAKAEEIADKSIAAGPYWNNLGLKITLALEWRGDTALALATLQRMPPAVLQEDFGIGFANWVYEWAGKRSERLAFLSGVAKEWLNSQMYAGPRAYLVGRTRLALGQKEAAERELRQALQLIEQKLRPQPNDASLLSLKAHTLHFLGEPAEAQKAYRLAKQIRPAQWSFVFETPDAVLAELERAYERKLYWPTAASLRLTPELGPFRELPRFQALQAKLDADPRTSPSAGAAKTSGAVATPDPKSIAVLAFRPLSGDPENGYLCEAISDELCSVLGRVPGLKVAASASALSFAGGKRLRLSEMAAQLGVAYLVDGTVQKIGSRVRVRAELIKAADESAIWKSETLEHETKDMFAVQDEVVAAIARNLQLQLRTAAPAVVTLNSEAYRLYYEGRRAWTLRATREFVEQAENLFRQAIAADPNLGRAYAGLADARRIAWTMEPRNLTFGQRQSERMRELLALAETALRHEPESAEAHTARGGILWQAWRVPEAERDLRTAVRLNPNLPDAHLTLGRLLGADGRVEEGLSALKRAAELDPLSSRIMDNLALGLREAGRYTEGLAAVERALALQPGSRQALLSKCELLALLDRPDEALEVARQIPDGVEGRRAQLYARVGKRDDAERLLREAIAAKSRGTHLVLMSLGRHDEALRWLQAEETSMTSVSSLLYSDILDPVRADPRFAEYLRTLGLQEAHARAQAWRAAHPPEQVPPKK